MNYMLMPGVKRQFPTTFNYIMGCVSQLLNIPVERIKLKSRERKYVEARQLFTILARESTKSSLKKIGLFLNKDHTSIIHSIKVYHNLMDTDIYYRTLYEKAKRLIA